MLPLSLNHCCNLNVCTFMDVALYGADNSPAESINKHLKLNEFVMKQLTS
jgi:hypothetical protein